MLRLLIAKDLLRAWRNPLPWLIFLLVPMFVVGLIGSVFGGRSASKALGRIRFALVDEDKSRLVEMLRGGLNQGKAAETLDPVFLERGPALKELGAGKLSAVVVIPKGFTDAFLAGRPTKLELVKNPAESIKPTVMEELLGVLVAGLNALDRNFAPELSALREVLDGRGDYHRVAQLIEQGGEKVKALGDFINPPLVGYTKTQQAAQPSGKERGPGFNLFGYLLLGMGGMFMLFLGGIGIGDLHREVQMRTLERFRTVHDSLAPFLVAKVAFAGVMLLLCAAVVFGGGALLYGARWSHPVQLSVLVLAYSLFVAGLMALIVAWLPDQRKADALRTIVSMLLGIAGGCAFPTENFPAVFREGVMPLLPTHWFVSAARRLEYGSAGVPWPLAAAELAAAGVVCLALASWLFRSRFLKGAHA